jgi:hypothetical protein
MGEMPRCRDVVQTWGFAVRNRTILAAAVLRNPKKPLE